MTTKRKSNPISEVSEKMNRLKLKAWENRLAVLDIVMAGKCGHIGGDMSVIDALTVIYDRMNISPESAEDPDRDRFVLSKGHCVEALYAVLADKGFLNFDDILKTYSSFASEYIGHPHNTLLGIEMCSGSLGHGLSVSTGMALAGKRDGRNYRVFTVMGDGELAEGSVWEAAMAASQFRLDNLTAVVDRNRLQISGTTEEVMHQDDVKERFTSFGWNVISTKDGNDVDELSASFDEAERVKDKPTLIVANTVKGCGSKVMENKTSWHHHVPSDEEYALIRADLEKRIEEIKHE